MMVRLKKFLERKVFKFRWVTKSCKFLALNYRSKSIKYMYLKIKVCCEKTIVTCMMRVIEVIS